jgi:hypothetical protein
MWTAVADQPALEWGWAEARLRDAAMYWVDPVGPGHPHPRPVWGVWAGEELHLSIGSPVVQRLLAADRSVTVHLDSSLEVVILEGTVTGPTTDTDLVAAYDRKYDWRYDLEQYGPLTTVRPARVLAWHSVGEAGRDGFAGVGRWRFPP